MAGTSQASRWLDSADTENLFRLHLLKKTHVLLETEAFGNYIVEWNGSLEKETWNGHGLHANCVICFVIQVIVDISPRGEISSK